MKAVLQAIVILFVSLNIYANDSIPNLRPVKPGIFRSGRPTQQGLKDLVASQQIRLVVDIEESMSSVRQEQEWSHQLGVEFVSIPMSAFSRPKDADVERILSLIKNRANQPLLIHCQHGEDRTGLIIGLHRVFEDKWTADQAYQEMLDLGFHQILFPLDQYFHEKTGLQALSLNALGL